MFGISCIQMQISFMNLSAKYLNRDSSIELIRILSIIGILVVHTDFFALGAPTKEDCVASPLLSIWRFLIESITIISVNIFILISGWFGIRWKKKRFLEFLFQILFFNILFFVVFSFFIPEKTISRDGIGSIFMFDKFFWFVKAYILLYLLAPVLNSFLENASKSQHKLILIGFFIFQTIYGWLFDGVSWFERGYSAISFVGLYILANYLRKYIKIEKRTLILIFIAFVILNTSVAFMSTYIDRGAYVSRLYAYNSPFVILASVALFLFFTKIHLKSKIVNYIAISSFAAFLFHANHFFIDEVYVSSLKKWFGEDTIVLFSVKTIILVFICFSLAIIIDKFRIYIWEIISRRESS